MMHLQNEDRFSFILFKIGQIGPQQLYFESLPAEIIENFEQISSIELGLYLSLVISQEKGMDKEGLFGPLPWYALPNHELYLFSFLVKDPISKDNRKKEQTMCFLVVLFPKKDEAVNYARYEIEKALEEQLIKEKEKRIVISDEEVNNIITSSKQIFSNALGSGKKISQEKALDEVISLESMEQFALYSIQERKLKSCIIGNEEDLPEEKILDSHKNGSTSLISVEESDNGTSNMILEFKEQDTIIYVKLNQSIKCHSLIRLISQLDKSLEILSEYIEDK